MITLTSFGYLHLDVPPRADRVEDVRDRLRDPAAARAILDLDGLDPRVQQVVARTPGAEELLENLAAYADLVDAAPSRIAIGCAGGRHRAPSLVELLAERLRDGGHDVRVEHLHVHLPRVIRGVTPAGEEPPQCPALDETGGVRCTRDAGHRTPHRFPALTK